MTTQKTNPVVKAYENTKDPESLGWWIDDSADFLAGCLNESTGTAADLLDAIGMWDDLSESSMGWTDSDEVMAQRRATVQEAHAVFVGLRAAL